MRVVKEELTILDAPVFEDKAVDKSLIAKITYLEQFVECLLLAIGS